jgi:hypothetical protein
MQLVSTYGFTGVTAQREQIRFREAEDSVPKSVCRLESLLLF